MARSRYSQFKMWMSEKAKSKPAQVIVSIANGAGASGGTYYLFDLFFSAISGGNTYVALKVFNIFLSLTAFVATTTMAADRISTSIENIAKFEENIREKLDTVFIDNAKVRDVLTHISAEIKVLRNSLNEVVRKLLVGTNQVIELDSLNPQDDIKPFDTGSSKSFEFNSAKHDSAMSPLMASIEMKPLSAQHSPTTPLGNFNFMSQTNVSTNTSLRESLSHASSTSNLREPLLANDSLSNTILDIRSPQNISSFKF